MTCTFCRRPLSGCACVQAQCCGGVVFADEFADAHRCASAWGELNYQVGFVAHEPPDGSIESMGGAGLGSGPRPVHTAVLSAPELGSSVRALATAAEHATAATRPLR